MRNISSALLTAVSTLAFANLASAADLPVKAPRPVAVAPVYNWTGFYIGGNVGYSWGNVDSTLNLPALASFGLPTTVSDTTKPDGIIGGGQIGYNWQTGPWVFGVEADFQGSGQKDSNNFSESFTYVLPVAVAVVLGTGTVAVSHEEKLEWFGTVRGRVGYAVVPDVLLYATGGLAYGNVNSSVTGTITTASSSASATISESDTKTGWTVGAGIEGAIPNLQNWTWKLEYLYIDLGTVNYAYTSAITGPVTASNDITDNIVRAGINYRF